MKEVTWSTFKTFIQSRSLSIQQFEENDTYYMWAVDGAFSLSCCLYKDNSSDVQDFENNFKASSNKSFSDSEGIPLTKSRAFANSDGFRFRGKGIKSVCNAGISTNIDYKLTEERWINGVDLIVKNHILGDSVKFQVVDKEYVYAGILYPSTYSGGVAWNIVAPNGVLLDEFGSDWFLADDTQKQQQVLIPYPAKILPNLYIRLVYTSTGVNNVDLYINLFLHKKT